MRNIGNLDSFSLDQSLFLDQLSVSIVRVYAFFLCLFLKPFLKPRRNGWKLYSLPYFAPTSFFFLKKMVKNRTFTISDAFNADCIVCILRSIV